MPQIVMLDAHNAVEFMASYNRYRMKQTSASWSAS
jgi:hypothetical protein